jgi:hypothetical protein
MNRFIYRKSNMAKGFLSSEKFVGRPKKEKAQD